jgi:hypothetical protein
MPGKHQFAFVVTRTDGSTVRLRLSKSFSLVGLRAPTEDALAALAKLRQEVRATGLMELTDSPSAN